MRTREVTLALTELEHQANTQAKDRVISESECRKIIAKVREIERLMCAEQQSKRAERSKAEKRKEAVVLTQAHRDKIKQWIADEKKRRSHEKKEEINGNP